MNVVFTPTAWEQYTEWQREDKKTVKRINELIKDIDRNGSLSGIGKPELLKYRKQERYIKECGDLLRAKYILECNQNREKRQLNIVLKFAPLTIISILINNIIGALVSENVFSIINFFLKDNTNIILITAFISYVFWIYNLHQKLSSTEKLLCSVEIRLKKQELHDSENKL